MKQKAIQFIKHPLISGSAVVFVGSITGNLFHFLFNLLMSRNLSITEYGILISLISLTAFPALVFNSLIPITVNFATGYLAKSEYDKTKGLYLSIGRIMFMSGAFFMMFFTFFAPLISRFIHVEGKEPLIILTGAIVWIGLMNLVNMAFLQAKLDFKFVSLMTFLGGFLKFLTAVGLIYIGYGIGGILFGFIIGGILSYAIGIFPLKFIFQKKVKPVSIGFKKIIGYGTPATIALFCMTSFITSDIILVKHFFSASDAGLYAGLSLIGRVVFYFSAPIGMVMFPLAVKKFAKNESHNRLLMASLILVLLPSIALTIFYFIMPEFSIKFFLKNTEYAVIADKLGMFGIYMTIYSLLSVLVNFYLSIQKTFIYIPVMLAAFLQVFLIFIFHNSLFQVIQISLTISGVLLVLLLIYYAVAIHPK